LGTARGHGSELETMASLVSNEPLGEGLRAHDLQEASAWHAALQASTLLTFDGVEIGLAFPVGAVGAEPQVLRMASLGDLLDAWFDPVFEPAVDPVLPPALEPVLVPVLEELLDPVAAPVGFDAVGTTAGTEVHALS
jgi:hypothetical protein